MNCYFNFCNERKLNPWKADVSIVLDFLVLLYKRNLSYSSINMARSALSMFLPKLNGFNIGSHPLVVRMLKAIFRARPPVAKYSSTWNVDTLLTAIESWPDNENLPIDQLSFKLVGLLALATAQRAQTLAAINIDDIELGDVTTIRVGSILKTSRPGAHGCTIRLEKLLSRPKICVLSCLRSYLFRTLQLRKSSMLFISCKAPHKAVTTQTISRWLKGLLDRCGISNIYMSHSYRHASVSKAYVNDVPIDMIYNSAGWSTNSRMFARHYNRKIVDANHCKYSNTVLS